MRSSLLLLFAAALLLGGCRDEGAGKAPRAQPSSRFDSVQAERPAAANFCERAYPAQGEEAKPFHAPPLRPLPAGVKAQPTEGAGWRWLNLWATWCEPCKEELPLLARWRDAMAREGTPFELELLSVDEPQEGAKLAAFAARGLPGRLSWLASASALEPFLVNELGVGSDAALPIHALIDPAGRLRCVRVGAVHESDYGAVRALLGGK